MLFLLIIIFCVNTLYFPSAFPMQPGPVDEEVIILGENYDVSSKPSTPLIDGTSQVIGTCAICCQPITRATTVRYFSCNEHVGHAACFSGLVANIGCPACLIKCSQDDSDDERTGCVCCGIRFHW